MNIYIPPSGRWRPLKYKLLLAECAMIAEAVNRLGSIGAAAKELKVSRNTIYRRIWSGKIKVPQYKGEYA
jgi:transcriptional regulator with PAS, ATPase and Fis domain